MLVPFGLASTEVIKFILGLIGFVFFFFLLVFKIKAPFEMLSRIRGHT